MCKGVKDFVNSLPNVSTQYMLASVGAKSRNFLVATWDASVGIDIYAPQTKIFGDRTKGRACIFEVLFEGS